MDGPDDLATKLANFDRDKLEGERYERERVKLEALRAAEQDWATKFTQKFTHIPFSAPVEDRSNKIVCMCLDTRERYEGVCPGEWLISGQQACSIVVSIFEIVVRVPQ